MEKTVLTVSELNNRIKNLLGMDPMLQNICVQGELSNYKVYPSGHHYFDLKDTEGKIRCVMFKSSALRLRFRPESGMGVIAFGRIDLYNRDGAYQLYCTGLNPQGLGDLYLAFEQLKAKLAAEGLFSPEHKKPIPRFPERIAVITSGAGAAVRDIIRVSGQRWPLSKLIIMPVRVQGAEAPPEIVGAIAYANRHRVADLIITGRGGGSIEDLWAFNDERVARAIYASEIPVISAVGHEPDVTIADYVADLRAATPSNAAELAVPDMDDMRRMFSDATARCTQAVGRTLGAMRSRLEELGSRRVMRSPGAYVDIKRIGLDRSATRLEAAGDRLLAERRRNFVGLTAALDALSPLKVLSRGYAFASDGEGRVLRRVGDVEVGGRIAVELSDGALDCLVEKKRKRGNNDGK